MQDRDISAICFSPCLVILRNLWIAVQHSRVLSKLCVLCGTFVGGQLLLHGVRCRDLWNCFVSCSSVRYYYVVITFADFSPHLGPVASYLSAPSKPSGAVRSLPGVPIMPQLCYLFLPRNTSLLSQPPDIPPHIAYSNSGDTTSVCRRIFETQHFLLFSPLHTLPPRLRLRRIELQPP